MGEELYKKFAGYYDRIYENVNYREETEFIKWAIENHRECEGKNLLDVACGTGTHVQPFGEKYGLKPVCIAETGLIKGIGKIAGMDIVDIDGATGGIDTNLENIQNGILETASKDYDFLLINVDGADEAGHDGQMEEKVKFIEKADSIVGEIMIKPRKVVEELDPYVPGRSIDEIASEYGVELDRIIKLGSNENPMGPSPQAVKAIVENLKLINQYPESDLQGLVSEIAEYSGVSPENIIAGGDGADEILDVLGKTFMESELTDLVDFDCRQHWNHLMKNKEILKNLKKLLNWMKNLYNV